MRLILVADTEAAILNDEGKFLKEYGSEKTPQTSSPEKVMSVIGDFAKRFPEYDKITAGFRGYIKNGIVGFLEGRRETQV
ncbi:MAG TPA: hypothetical protein VIJ57_06530 [Hanamia sp.]